METTNYEAILVTDPGNPLFAEYAENLLSQGKLKEAQDICLAGLSANPSFSRGRLVLARVFFERSFVPFAVRELEVLREEIPENKFVQRLVERLAPDVANKDQRKRGADNGEDTVAETDFDIGEIELLEKDDGDTE